jgi:hypothetical protein
MFYSAIDRKSKPHYILAHTIISLYNHLSAIYRQRKGGAQYVHLIPCRTNHSSGRYILHTECPARFHRFSFLEVSGISGDRNIHLCLNGCCYSFYRFPLAPHKAARKGEENRRFSLEIKAELTHNNVMDVGTMRVARAGRAAGLFLLVWIFAFSFPPSLFAASLSPAQEAEIAHMISYIEKSGCEFFRNGTWYKEAKPVREHVEKKYRYFLGKQKINSAEDFIKWSATKSELSGKQYMVRCEKGSEGPMSEWLSVELDRYRKEKPAH